MEGLNKVLLIGNLGRTPELRHTKNGSPVCNFSIATTERWTDQSGSRQEKTEWHDVVTWARLAETCAEHLAKGRTVYVEGRLQTRTWTGRDGQEKSRQEVKADRVIFLGGRSLARGYSDSPEGQRDAAQAPHGEDDGIPF
jgi:single-strand DNA-binding protein